MRFPARNRPLYPGGLNGFASILSFNDSIGAASVEAERMFAQDAQDNFQRRQDERDQVLGVKKDLLDRDVWGVYSKSYEEAVSGLVDEFSSGNLSYADAMSSLIELYGDQRSIKAIQKENDLMLSALDPNVYNIDAVKGRIRDQIDPTLAGAKALVSSGIPSLESLLNAPGGTALINPKGAADAFVGDLRTSLERQYVENPVSTGNRFGGASTSNPLVARGFAEYEVSQAFVYNPSTQEYEIKDPSALQDEGFLLVARAHPVMGPLLKEKAFSFASEQGRTSVTPDDEASALYQLLQPSASPQKVKEDLKLVDVEEEALKKDVLRSRASSTAATAVLNSRRAQAAGYDLRSRMSQAEQEAINAEFDPERVREIFSSDAISGDRRTLGNVADYLNSGNVVIHDYRNAVGGGQEPNRIYGEVKVVGSSSEGYYLSVPIIRLGTDADGNTTQTIEQELKVVNPEQARVLFRKHNEVNPDIYDPNQKRLNLEKKSLGDDGLSFLKK